MDEAAEDWSFKSVTGDKWPSELKTHTVSKES